MAKVPDPVLDTRNGDQVIAQVVGSLPDELSDRSDSNPAVVMSEALGAFFDKLIYQVNQWPRALYQKLAALIGVDLISPVGASATQQFTLSSPQPKDTTIPLGTLVANNDGSIVFATTADTSVPAYVTQAGTIQLIIGSNSVNGTSTLFDNSWVGQMIQVQNGDWYTVASVLNHSVLNITTPATSNAQGSFNVGQISATAPATATETGVGTNVGSGVLTVLQSSVAGVGSTTNITAATGGADQETVTDFVERAPSAFATRDVAVTSDDHAEFAKRTLGPGSRASARGGYNADTAVSGAITVACLSPNWSSTVSVTTQELANVSKDLSGRTGAQTLIVQPVTIDKFTTSPTLFACAIVRSGSYSPASAQANVAGVINSYLSPEQYPWTPDAYLATGYRPIDVTDLVQQVESAEGVDKVYAINGVPAIGMNYQTSVASMTFANGSATVNSVGATDWSVLTAGQSFIVDAANSQVYLVIAKPSGSSLTLDRSWTGSSAAISSVPFWTAQSTALSHWYSLPYSQLSVSTSSPAASIVVVGSI